LDSEVLAFTLVTKDEDSFLNVIWNIKYVELYLKKIYLIPVEEENNGGNPI